jgi:N-acetylmuramic acid 6-phosphate etherase
MSLPDSQPVILGIESGGTRTVALAATDDGHALLRREFGPANLRLLDDTGLRRHFLSIARVMPRSTAVAIGMAGARTEQDRERIRKAAAVAWKGVPSLATNDLETALRAAPPADVVGRVLILSGTGSCCFGQRKDGKPVKIGGWGHILGDKGSGYEIGLRGLKASIYHYDRDGKWPALGARLLRALTLNEPNDLITWAQSASKTDIAALAVEVFAAWETEDEIASDILAAAANSLARDGLACATRLGPQGKIQFVLAGSVLMKQPKFAAVVSRSIAQRRPGSIVSLLHRESVWGAVELAKTQVGRAVPSAPLPTLRKSHNPFAFTSVASLKKSPTEMRNPRSMKLDRMSVRDSIRLMLGEDARLPAALLKELPSIEKAVEIVSRSLKHGGSLFYVGAGTSGRLGVLDASECPPTFQTPPEMVQGIIAGGQRALWQAVEGAEDDPEAGARAITFRGVGSNDVVVGIAASGRTPFVWGALAEGKRRGACTILLSFNPFLDVQQNMRPTVTIAPNIGPEILTGSTRLKSGTATKLVLNMLTTLSMVRLGKVMSNLMIDVKASNVKLRDRAVRMVCELTRSDYASATRALEATKWRIKDACRRLKPATKTRPGKSSR